MSAFYEEDLNIGSEDASNIQKFMDFLPLKAVINPQPWAQHGKARVYFTMWSQNNLNAIERLDKCFYDADLDDVILQFYIFGSLKKYRLKEIFSIYGKSFFSGAKTRAAIAELQEVFYG